MAQSEATAAHGRMMRELGGGQFVPFGSRAPGGPLACGVPFGESGAVLECLGEPCEQRSEIGHGDLLHLRARVAGT